jgi:protein disulfide-isomerase
MNAFYTKRQILNWSVALAVLLTGVILSGCNRPDPTHANEAANTDIWMTDYDTALKKAAEENKYVFVSISGLDWCRWCIQFEKEVLSQPEFIDYAKENLIPVLLDFKHNGGATSEEFSEQHKNLLKKFRISGFPAVLILNPNGKVIERDGYQRGGALNYIDFIKTVIAADS